MLPFASLRASDAPLGGKRRPRKPHLLEVGIPLNGVAPTSMTALSSHIGRELRPGHFAPFAGSSNQMLPVNWI